MFVFFGHRVVKRRAGCSCEPKRKEVVAVAASRRVGMLLLKTQLAWGYVERISTGKLCSERTYRATIYQLDRPFGDHPKSGWPMLFAQLLCILQMATNDRATDPG